MSGTAALRFRDGLRGLIRCLREATGEAKWDDYLAACRAAGTNPTSRREFELHRAHQKERDPRMRCC